MALLTCPCVVCVCVCVVCQPLSLYLSTFLACGADEFDDLLELMGDDDDDM